MVFLTKSFGTMASNDDKFSSVSGSPRGAKRWNFVCARTSFLLLFPRPYLLFSSRRRYPALPSLHRSFQHERVSTLSRWHVNLRSATLFKEYLDETFRSAFETRPVSCKMLWATRSISPFQWCNSLDSVFFLFFPFLTQKNILPKTHTHTHTPCVAVLIGLANDLCSPTVPFRESTEKEENSRTREPTPNSFAVLISDDDCFEIRHLETQLSSSQPARNEFSG